MKNGERIGYSLFKENYKDHVIAFTKDIQVIHYTPVFGQKSRIDDKYTGTLDQKHTKKTLDPDLDGAIQLLFSFIEKHIELFFAIEINEAFKQKFMSVAGAIKEYYVDERSLSPGDIDADDESNMEILKIEAAASFIAWLKERMTIKVEKIPFDTPSESQFQIGLRFPNVEAANLMLAHLRWDKTIGAGRFGGRDSPSQDPQNPAVLKFPCFTRGNQAHMCFAEAKMGRKLFNMLGELSTQLKAYSFIRTEVPFTDIFAETDSKESIRVPTPEYLFGYERILIGNEFPKATKIGTLYVKVDQELKNISLKSTSIPQPQTLDANESLKVRAALKTDQIEIKSDSLKKGQFVEVYPSQTAFAVIKSICPFPSALSLKNGTQPVQGFFGEQRVPKDQALSLSIFKEAALQALLDEARKSDNEAAKNLLNALKENDIAEKQLTTASSNKNTCQIEYKTLEKRIAEAQEKVKSLEWSFAFSSVKTKTIFWSQESASKAKRENKQIEADLKSANENLDSLRQQLLNCNLRLSKTTSKYQEALATKTKANEKLEKCEQERSRTLSIHAETVRKSKAAFTTTSTTEPTVTLT